MKKAIFLFTAFCTFVLNAQTISVENIWKGKYYPQQLWGINSMNDGESYTIQEQDGIYKYAYQNFITGQSQKELIVSGQFDDYKFSSDEKYMLVLSESVPIYRHSVKGKWQVYDREKEIISNDFRWKTRSGNNIFAGRFKSRVCI